jgi:hypothetical protein
MTFKETNVKNSRMLMIFSVVLALSLSAIAGDRKISKKDVPAAVLTAFETTYPKAVIKGLAIEKEDGKTFYEIESVDGKLSRDLLYLADGTVFEIEEGVTGADLPAAVKSAVVKEHPKGKVSKCEKTTHGSDVVYDCQVISGKAKYSMVIAPDGKVIKNQKAGSPKKAKEEKEEKED